MAGIVSIRSRRYLGALVVAMLVFVTMPAVPAGASPELSGSTLQLPMPSAIATPTAVSDAYSTHEYGELTVKAPGVLGNDTEPDGEPMTAALAPGGDVSHGTLTLRANGSFRYIPDDGFNGTDYFWYRASDGDLQSRATTVTLTVHRAASGLHGTVLDYETRTKLKGIVVRAVEATSTNPAGTSRNWTAVTDAQGNFRLGLSNSGWHYLTFCDPEDVYRDSHAWGEAIPIGDSVPIWIPKGLNEDFTMPMIPIDPARWDRVERVSGSSRYETAMEVADFFGKAETVVLASGEDYPDALAAAPLAGSYNAPILLTMRDRLPDGLLAKLDELGTTSVVIVGGTAAVSETVRTALQAQGLAVSRIAGSDRYDTAAAIVRQLMFREGSNLRPEPWIVRGDQFADALAVAPFAWLERRPILLVRPDSAPAPAVSAFDSLNTDLVFVAGGTAAVQESALVDLWEGALMNEGKDLWLVRFSGADRYETAVAVVNGWGRPLDMYAVASGTNFPDALAGGPFMGNYWGALLLTPPTSLATAPRTVLAEDGKYIWQVMVLGGAGALSGSVESAIGTTVGTAVYDMDFLSGVMKAANSAWMMPLAENGFASATTEDPKTHKFEGALRRPEDGATGFETSDPVRLDVGE